jgi:hypothetical protein
MSSRVRRHGRRKARGGCIAPDNRAVPGPESIIWSGREAECVFDGAEDGSTGHGWDDGTVRERRAWGGGSKLAGLGTWTRVGTCR